MKAWFVTSRLTDSSGTWSAPGRMYCGDRSRSGAYIGCGKLGAAMIGRIGSGGFQVSPGPSVMIEPSRAGTVMAGSSRCTTVSRSACRSRAGAGCGSGAAACSASASGTRAARNRRASAESATALAPAAPGAGSGLPGVVTAKSGRAGTSVMAAGVSAAMVRGPPAGLAWTTARMVPSGESAVMTMGKRSSQPGRLPSAMSSREISPPGSAGGGTIVRVPALTRAASAPGVWPSRTWRRRIGPAGLAIRRRAGENRRCGTRLAAMAACTVCGLASSLGCSGAVSASRTWLVAADRRWPCSVVSTARASWARRSSALACWTPATCCQADASRAVRPPCTTWAPSPAAVRLRGSRLSSSSQPVPAGETENTPAGQHP